LRYERRLLGPEVDDSPILRLGGGSRSSRKARTIDGFTELARRFQIGLHYLWRHVYQFCLYAPTTEIVSGLEAIKRLTTTLSYRRG